jgi:mxaJ protein
MCSSCSDAPAAVRRSRYLLRCAAVLLAVVSVTAFAGRSSAGARILRVCADPNNLPFSNRRGDGFENRLAQLLAREIGANVQYTWWAQRRGFVRNTIMAGRCDVVMGVPTGYELVLRTDPYYRSTYVFVTRGDVTPPISTFDDPRLRTLRVGVQMIGDDGANSPPAHALARRGIVRNVRGYMVFGDYTSGAPQEPIVRAVASGELDVAVVWGPTAGYFARHSSRALRLTAVRPQIEQPFLPFVFDIAVGVRRGDSTLRAELNDALTRRRIDISKLLEEYGIPRVGATQRGR